MEAEVELLEGEARDGDTLQDAIRRVAYGMGIMSSTSDSDFEVFWTNRLGELQFLSSASDVGAVLRSNSILAVSTSVAEGQGAGADAPPMPVLDCNKHPRSAEDAENRGPMQLVHAYF